MMVLHLKWFNIVLFQQSVAANDIALQFVLLIIGVLSFVTIYLMASSILVRNNRLRKEHYFELRKEQLYPLILDYMVEESSDKDPIIQLVRRKEEITPFVKIMYELLDSVDGNEVGRLKELLGIPYVQLYHARLLRKKNKNALMQSCAYFARLGTFSDGEYDTLRKHLDHPSLLMVHAASTAIMATDDVAKRTHAFRKVLVRQRVSRLSLLDLLYLYHYRPIDQMEEESKYLFELIRDKTIPDHNIAMLIKGICDIGYVNLGLNLFELIEQDYWLDSDLVSDALVYAMGRFGYGFAADLIVEKFASHERALLRRSCAGALEAFNDDAYAPVLYQLAADHEFSVKVKAIYALAGLGDLGRDYLDQLSNMTHELRVLIRGIVLEVEDGVS
jgi:hypothetical protein